MGTTTELSAAIRTTISAMHRTLRQKMTAISAFSMTEVDTIGHLLKKDALLPTELAALTKVKTQSMSQILKKLEEQGLIKRTPSKDDKRKVYISPTAAARKMLERTQAERNAWLNETLEKKFSTKEKALLGKAMPLLRKLAEA